MHAFADLDGRCYGYWHSYKTCDEAGLEPKRIEGQDTRNAMDKTCDEAGPEPKRIEGQDTLNAMVAEYRVMLSKAYGALNAAEDRVEPSVEELELAEEHAEIAAAFGVD